MRYAALLAGLAVLITWLLVWAKILGHPSADTFRYLLVGGGAVLLASAGVLALVEAAGAVDVAIIGGLAAVAAGALGVLVGAVLGVISAIAGGVSGGGGPGGAGSGPKLHVFGLHRLHASGLQHFGWDLYLLVVSVALVWAAARLRVRGLGYVGGLGLVAFIISVGAQITRTEVGRAATGDALVWPLVLLIAGAALMGASALGARRG